MQTSTRRGISYPNTTSKTDSPDIPTHIANLVAALELDVLYLQGTLASRPSASLAGRIYVATDQTPHTFYWDNGSSWDQIGSTPAPSFGLLSARPLANVSVGKFYYATDQDSVCLSDGTNWIRVGHQPGDILWTAESTARTGYLICTGQSWPATTGIYADLFARWSSSYPSLLPDMPGREFVAKGTHADVDTVGKTEGLAAASRRPRHKSSKNGTATLTGTVGFTDPQHTHGGNVMIPGGTGPGGGLGGQQWVTIPLASTGITVNNGSLAVNDPITIGPQTGAEPTDSGAYITLQPQVKL